MSILRWIPQTRRLLFVLVLGGVLGLPWLGIGGYGLYLSALGGSYALAALGLNLIMGYGPDISLGQHAFFAIGAYATAVSMTQLNIPFPVALTGASILSGALSLLIALSAVRLHGLYLAIGTLAFGLVVDVAIRSASGITGGRNGMAVPAFAENITQAYLITMAILVGVFLMYRNFIRGGYGALLVSMRDNQVAAQSSGVSIVKMKLMTFGIGGLLAGLGGGLYGGLVSYIASESFSLNLSLLFILMVVVGGAGTIYGPLVGAAFVTILSEFTRDIGSLNNIVYGLAVVFVILFAPTGIVGLLAGGAEKLRHRVQRVGAEPDRPQQSVGEGQGRLVGRVAQTADDDHRAHE